MREQGQLPPGPLGVDEVLRALDRLGRRSISQLLLRRNCGGFGEIGSGGIEPKQPKPDYIKQKETPRGVASLFHFYDEAAGSHVWCCTLCFWEKKYSADEPEITNLINEIQDEYTKQWDVHACADHRDAKSN